MTGAETLTYTSASKRRDQLAQVVREEGYCTLLELSQRFDVSIMTIRRDISRLVEQNIVRAFHGGVGSLSPNDILGSDYRARDATSSNAKHAIATRALIYVAQASSIAIDAGTTAAQLAALITPAYHVKVVTQSLPAVTALAASSGLELECLGGDFHYESLSFSGPATLAAIADIHIDTLFLAASGLNERGAFCANGFDAITKRALIEVSDRVVLISDSSKFHTTATVRICGWDSIDTFVVDDGITAEQRSILNEQNVDIDEVTLSPAVSTITA